MDGVKSTFSNVKSGWTKIDKKKKKRMIATIAVIALVVIGLTYFANKVTYRVLFTNLELDDAGVIVNDLETKKIKYKVADGGTTILIDEDYIDTYRMELAMNGMLPENSIGFEIFDSTSMMLTEEDRQIMYQRALTGEIQRSIMSLDAINNAKVHLVLPQKSIFDAEEKQGSASIVIDVKPTKKITEEMIRGIAALVSGAVDNIPLENIQVVDSSGVLLSSFLADDGTSLGTSNLISKQQEVRRQFEKELETKLNNLLGSAFGVNKIKVSVFADMDFDSTESTIIEYRDPVVRSEQVDASGNNIDIQDVTGGNINDNISNVVQGVDGENSTYSKTTNNELTTETTSIIRAPGKINKISTSVIYDGQLSQANISNIQNIIATAIGYDAERGDLINVVGIEFNKDLSEDIPPTDTTNTNFIQDNLPLLIGIGVGSLIFIIGTVIILNSRKKRKEDKEFQENLTKGVTVEDTIKVLNENTIGEKIEAQPDTKGKMAKDYAKDNPELAAELIKAWLRE
ncbi:flagellar M-ring protein FliF [Soehngenia longivitae]|uniref:Flagellar M-ring protein n=1 Tax=Soehngenia longivitae TaxID=2562294 RepID=A0A4Z0D4M0_9FIRM|nr:flagellar basal-body MS-ring/collar protein FliF [Soehngenia longivitae]TFZ39916.1 flagellar M-ring protein FliF [Soehngenia longivitae]